MMARVPAAPAQSTNLAVIVRHAPGLNGNGRIEGSLQQLLGESATLNGGFALDGDLLVPGSPALRTNGNPAFAGTMAGPGSASPTGYQITLNGNCSLHYLRTRTPPVSLPTVAVPAQSAGTRNVTINSAGQSIGNTATLRDLTLNGNVGQVAVPPGNYGTFTANGGSGFVLGVAGAVQPAVYNLQNLNLNGQSRLDIVGPVLLVVANGFSANGMVGVTNHSSWLQLQIANGGCTLNGGCTIHGSVTAPAGTVIINGNSLLAGFAQCDRLTVNGGGCIKWSGSGAAANQPPTANSQNLITPEDTPLPITLAGSDPEGAALTCTLLSQPSHGTLSPQPSTPNQFTYTPASNFNGSDSFTFKVNDGQADSATATISLTITPVNDRPVALGQKVITPEDTPVLISLTGTDVDNDTLTYEIVAAPSRGTLNHQPSTFNQFIYTPAANTNGTDAFAFSVSDGQLRSTNTVSIVIQPVDDAPMGVSQTITTDEDTPAPVELTALDVEGDGLTFTNLTQPAHGILSGTPPHLIYSPATNYNGIDTFRFIASDGWLDSAPATITLIVKPVNDAPVADPQVIVTMEDTATNLVLTGTDVEGDSLSFTLLTAPTNGTLTGQAPNLVFSPAADFHGTNTFTFAADDGQATSAPVAITLIITPVNDQPVAEAQSLSLNEDTPTLITLHASDVDGDPLSFFIVASPTNGTLTLNTKPAPHNQYLYTPATNFNGVDCFTFEVNDGTTNSSPAVVTLAIQAVNDAPAAQPVGVTVTEDSVNNPIDVLANAADADNLRPPLNAGLTVVAAGMPAHGIVLNQITNLLYTPDADYFGTDSFSYTISDSSNATATAEVRVTVINVNDPPTAKNLKVNTLEDQAISGTVSAMDADGDDLTFALGNTAMKGVAMVEADGHFTYQPYPNTSGIDHFTFIVSDGAANSTGAVDVIIAPVNHAPAATPLLVTTEENAPLIIRLTAMDVDGDALTFTIETQPLHGTLSGTAPNLIYTPATDYTGSDSFTFKVDDGRLDSAPATVAVNVPPAAGALHLNVPGEQTIPCDQVLFFGAGRSISITDEDPSVGVLELSLSVSNGSLTLPWVDGLDWQAGANGDSHQVVQGTLNELNTALAGLTYLNSSGFSGPDLLSLAVDDLGNNDLGISFKDANTIPITVIAPPNAPPKVSIVVPTDTSQFQLGQTISVQVTATDGDGQVTNVTLFVDGLEFAQLAATPFDITWSGATLGRHLLSAKATDNRGATSISADVSVWVVDENGDFLVDAGPDQIISLPNAAFLAGAVVIQTPVVDAQTNVTWSKLDGPGNAQFSDPDALMTAVQFSESGSYILRLEVACAGSIHSDLIKIDVLPAPPDRLSATRSTKGTDFWLTFLANLEPYTETPYRGCDLFISADVNTVVEVTDSPDSTRRLQIPAGSSITVPVYFPINSDVSDSVQANAVHVTADHPVTVHGLNFLTYSTDGYLALPTSMLGTDYIVLAYQNSPSWRDAEIIDGGTEFAVVASENDTHVIIIPSATTESRLANVPYEILLQQGEVYRLVNRDGPNADFTGTTIKSDKPVAVFGGHVCALVPPSTPAGDHLVEELPPVNTWGRHFVTMPLATRTKGDTFRFLAATDGTRLAINGKIVASLNRGQFHEQILDGPAEILASQPILTAQYANGSDFDGSTGDPFMMLIPPFEQYGGDYTLSTPLDVIVYDDSPREVYTNNYVNLTVRTTGAGTILIDDLPVPASRFQLIGNNGYAGAQVPVSPGAHHFSAPVPFGICVYGWAPYESYAFMGGFYSESVESDTKLELTQPTPFAAVGHEKTVVARVTNGRGLPFRDVEVSFSVTGINAAAGRAATSRFGDAIFSYVGDNAGEDTITATLVDLEQAVTNTWIAASDNAPPVVSTASTQPQQLSLTAQLVGTVSDDGHPAGAHLQVRWLFLGGPGDVQFENATQSVTRAFCSLPGTYQFELIADDSQFSSRSVVDVAMIRPFTVELSGMDSGTWLSTNAYISLFASIDIIDGVYTNVEFFDGEVKLSEGMSTSLIMDLPSPGTHTITAVVTEEHGFQARSEPLQFFVTLPPQIEVALPDRDLTLPYANPTATFKAHAWEPDGTIANFAVYVGPLLVYQTNDDLIDFTGLVHDGRGAVYGVNPVHFTATDTHGISTEVYTVNINLLPPTTTVNFISPGDGEYLRAGQTVDFAIQASVTPPAQVTDVRLRYWDRGWMAWHTLHEWTWQADSPIAEPCISHWIPPSPGDYPFAVKVQTDAFSALESGVTIHVLPAIGVSIASPTNNATWFAGTPSQIALAVDDPTEVFDHAEFFVNGVSLGQTSNTWFEWVPPHTGGYSLTAKAYDHQEQAYIAHAPITIQVVTPPPPQVQITDPTDGDRLALGQETLVAVEVIDRAQAVTNLELIVDGVKATDSIDSYISWIPDSIGSHSMTVVAADWNGNRVASAPVTVTVVEMHPPTVTVTSPDDGTYYTAETLPSLRAEAIDPDGTVTNLMLELDGAVLGKTNVTTLELSATNILGGWHTILARATDNDGLTSSSAAVSFFIERSEDTNLPVPNQLAAEALSATEIRLRWLPLPTNTAAVSILVERWSPAPSAWIEIGKAPVTEIKYTDLNLNPQTCYRYRIATTDNVVHRSVYSAEVRATTRTTVPCYSVIDLTEALIALLTGPSANILTNSGLHHFDSRRAVPLGGSHAESALGTNATALKLAVARFKERWPQIQLDYDPVLLSPKSILPRLGYLTGPAGTGVTVSEATAQMFDSNDPDRPVKAFLQEYQALFGFGPEAITNANVQRDYVSAGNGARTVVWQQQVAGIPVFNALLIGHITPAGELACLSSEFIPSPAQAADPALLAAVQSGADLPFPSPLALVAAVTNAGDRFASGVVAAETDADGVTRRQTFTASTDVKGEAQAELVWFPADRSQLKLCWQVLFTSPWRDEMYLTLVTADTGEILYRRNLTAESSAATYRVYTNASPASLLPGLSAPGTTQPATAERSLVTLTALDDFASPDGWIAASDNETRGNNVDAHLDRNDDNSADLPRPAGSPSRVFDFPLDLTLAPANYGQAATVQLFYWDNWMHDALYQLGFTEASGNFQADNFGRGGQGDDAVEADAQDGLDLNDGRHADNANMSTPPDGFAPRMQMYMFNGAAPGRDGSLDAQIILHEYTHGLSTRLIGGGAGIDAVQTAGLGEGWSDFYALALLTDPAADLDGAYPMGSYVTYHGFGTAFDQNYYYGIRRYPYCTDPNKNPLTFADIDPGKASAHEGVPRNPLLGPFRAGLAGEVHSQGEVWCMMLWEMRANLIRKLGPAAGNTLALQLVTDGLKLSPPNPNFVQARDAILLADRMSSDGTNAPDIWNAFAKRGLGFNAKAPESYTTAGVQESHDLMPSLAAERVEIQGGRGAIELGVNNNLLIHLRNQGDAPATHVSGRLATAVAGVSVLQGASAYADIPQGGSRANDTMFQIQTGSGYVEGTPIDLMFAIAADQSAGANYLRLFTGVPGAEILFDNYSALADRVTNSPATRDLTPWDLAKAEPLWISDDARCLLKLGTNDYVLWTTDGNTYPIATNNFLPHRLTRSGVVVGTMTVTNGLDELTNQISSSVGAWWSFPLQQAVPATQEEYRWPKDAAPLSPAGKAYSWTNLTNGQPQFLTNVTIYPTLQDVWDMNSNGMMVGSVSVQESSSWEQILFGADGTMNWLTPTERGLDAGLGTNVVTELRYYALLTTAAQFTNIDHWRWLGPLDWVSRTAVALLVNGNGMIAGYGGVYTGNPTQDVLRPTHAFRAPPTGEFDGSAIIVTNDLGVLPGGLHSFPRAMNETGEIVGYSDYDLFKDGTPIFSPTNFHAAFWGLTNHVPDDLHSMQQLDTNEPPTGFSDAYAINDQSQVVGTSWRNCYLVLRTNITIVPDNTGHLQTNVFTMQTNVFVLKTGDLVCETNAVWVAALWQRNQNTNGVLTDGASSTTNAPFWEITDLNDRLTDPSWQVFNAVGINNDGLILAHATSVRQEKHAVLLVPMSMAVDNNRDGQIAFDDSDATSAGNPYRFWINDSHEHGDDESEVGADDQIPGEPAFVEDDNGNQIPYANYANNQINGRSDLVNFFPVALNLSNILKYLPPANGYEYHLLQNDGAVKFVYTSLTLSNAFDYLTNSTSSGYGAKFNEAVTNADTIRVIKSPGIALDPNWLAQVSKNGGTGIILLEGRSTTTQPMWLETWYNGNLLGGIALNLDISGVEQMFRHLNLCAYANGSAEVANRATVTNEPPTNGKNFVFLHGYNVNQQEARGVLSEVFKRMYWSGSKARFYGVTWNGAVSKELPAIQALPANYRFTPNYHTNVYNAFLTAPHLANFLGELSGETVIAAHSLGNMVVLSALNDCRNINVKLSTYFMIDAAVPMEALQSDTGYNPDMVHSIWKKYDNRLYASHWWQLFTNDYRITLTWSSRLINLQNVDIYNFYSSGEEVLRSDPADPPAGVLIGGLSELLNYWKEGVPFGTYAWSWQEKGKGTSTHDWFIGSAQGGWKFNDISYGTNHYEPEYEWTEHMSAEAAALLPDSQLRTNAFFYTSVDANLFGPNGSMYAQANRNRILSDAIPALTLPVGANPISMLAANNHNLNMQTEFETDWPTARSMATDNEAYKWHHSDFDYVAYPFTHKLFDEIANAGNLK